MQIIAGNNSNNNNNNNNLFQDNPDEPVSIQKRSDTLTYT